MVGWYQYFFWISLGDIWLLGFSSCEHIRSSIIALFSSVIVVQELPDPGLLSMELCCWKHFKSLCTETLFHFLLDAIWKFYTLTSFLNKIICDNSLSYFETTMVEYFWIPSSLSCKNDNRFFAIQWIQSLMKSCNAKRL